MWFGTRNGLNRYDGYRIVQFKQDLQKENTLSSNIITALAAGHDGTLWVGTLNGLDRFDPNTMDFTQYGYVDEYGEAFSEFDEISSIYVTSSGTVWVLAGNRISMYDEKLDSFMSWAVPFNAGTKLCEIVPYGDTMFWIASESGLYLFSMYDKSFRTVLNRDAQDISRGKKVNQRIFSIESGNDRDELYLGTNSGLLKYDHKSGILSEILYEGHKLGRIETIYKTDDGKLWIGAQRRGLYMLDDNKLVSFSHNSFDRTSLSSDKILSLYQDVSGVLWVGTLQGGVNTMDLNKRQYSVITPEIHSNEDAKVSAVMAEGDSVIWMGIGEGRIDRISRKSGLRKSYTIDFPNRHYAFDLGQVMSIKEKNADALWVGTGKGLYEMDKANGHSFPVNIYFPGTAVLYPNLINGMETDKDGNLWCCSPGGIFILKDGRVLRHITKDSRENSIPRNNIQLIYRDRRDTMWVASRGGGLSRFVGTVENPEFKNYSGSDEVDSLSHDNICSLYDDTDGNLWIGTWGGGLNVLDRKKEIFTHYTVNDGLLDNTVFGIAEDSAGILWFSTYSGLSSYDKESGDFSRFVFSDNNKNNEVLFAEMSMAPDDKLYLCGLDGLVEFDTDFSIRKEELRPVHITSVNSKDVNDVREIRLSYKEKSLSLDFASFDYTLTKGNYYYKLEGVDGNWINTNSHSVSYSNLSPGHYCFRLKYSDLYGNNSPETHLDVVIVPPFWATTLAYVIYGLIILTVLIAVARYFVLRNRKKQELMQEEMRMEGEKALYDAKMKFFTNISHEIRTPLTLILGPVQKLKAASKDDPELTKMVDMMEKNGERLLGLVNQLLDFRKIDSGNMKTVMSQINLLSMMERLTALFADAAAQENIRLSLDIHSKISISADADKVEKILCNLISNAIKFTKTFVEVSLTLDGDKVKISVTDDGPGISEEQAGKIFDRFYQIENHSRGTGIGLNLSLELARLMEGNLCVSTPEVGNGSVFTLTLPARDLEIQDAYSIEKIENEELTSDKPLIVVVDDNEDLRFFISSALSHDYRILEAPNGEKAMCAFDKSLPDMVISDIMMPGISGLELIKKIRDNRKMFNIPIIIVSAKSSDEDRVRCLEAGADAYITKPFSGQYLKLQVDKLIQLQQKAREKLQMEIMTTPGEIEVKSSSHKILQQIVALLEEHIADPEFNVETLSESLNMSRMQLYRLMKNMLGETPAEFIRNFRLSRAASLLEKKEFNVNEVCYMVGFNDPKYFTSIFKKKYGVLPRNYEKTDK